MEYETCVDEARLEQVAKFIYLGCVLNESGTDNVKCCSKVVSGRKVACAIRSLINARSLQLEYAHVLHEGLFVSVLLYGSETMIWREKERSRIRAVQTDNPRVLLGIRRMDRVLNERFRELCRVAKGVDEMIDENILHWFGHIGKMENDRITNRVYVGECVGS